MIDFSGLSSAFFRPETGGIEGLQRATAAQRAAEPREADALPATAAPSGAAKEDAAYWVSSAEDSIGRIGLHMNSYNSTKNRPDSYWTEKEKELGSEWVAQKRIEDVRMMEVDTKIMEMSQQWLTRNFEVKGTIYQKNSAGDFEFGKFQLSRSGPGYAILIDSEEGSKVVFGGRSSESSFSRAWPVNQDWLPWDTDRGHRTDLIA
jgi:hypothetical protein